MINPTLDTYLSLSYRSTYPTLPTIGKIPIPTSCIYPTYPIHLTLTYIQYSSRWFSIYHPAQWAIKLTGTLFVYYRKIRQQIYRLGFYLNFHLCHRDRHFSGKKHRTEPRTQKLLDMSVQNLCFDHLFNKKVYMKYNNILP